MCLVICNNKKSEIFKSIIVKLKKEFWINVTTACRTGVKASLGKIIVDQLLMKYN